jgi:hypothetical protein
MGLSVFTFFFMRRGFVFEPTANQYGTTRMGCA